jgi:hypothetical protein
VPPLDTTEAVDVDSSVSPSIVFSFSGSPDKQESTSQPPPTAPHGDAPPAPPSPARKDAGSQPVAHPRPSPRQQTRPLPPPPRARPPPPPPPPPRAPPPPPPPTQPSKVPHAPRSWPPPSNSSQIERVVSPSADVEFTAVGKGWFQRARAVVGKQLAQQHAGQAGN